MPAADSVAAAPPWARLSVSRLPVAPWLLLRWRPPCTLHDAVGSAHAGGTVGATTTREDHGPRPTSHAAQLLRAAFCGAAGKNACSGTSMSPVPARNFGRKSGCHRSAAGASARAGRRFYAPVWRVFTFLHVGHAATRRATPCDIYNMRPQCANTHNILRALRPIPIPGSTGAPPRRDTLNTFTLNTFTYVEQLRVAA